MSLQNDSRIIDLRQRNETQKNQFFLKNFDNNKQLNSNLFYSDSIYRINAQNEKERRILCITPYYMYIINPMENFKLIRKIKVGMINRLTFSNSNSNLCVIHVIR